MVYFDSRLLQGTRVAKVHSSDWAAFVSPNSGPTAYFNGAWHVNQVLYEQMLVRMCSVLGLSSRASESEIRSAIATGSFDKWWVYLPDESMRVLVMKLFPGCARHVLSPSQEQACRKVMDGLHLSAGDSESLVAAKTAIKEWAQSIDGVVVEVYGAGNAQSAVQFVLRELHDVHFKPIAWVTECRAGGTSHGYAVAMKNGTGVNMNDCTATCAYVKMQFLVARAHRCEPANAQWRRDYVEQELRVSYRGELSDEDSKVYEALRVTRY